MSDMRRPFITARAAAAALCVPQSVIEADVRRIYPLDCLIGADVGGTVYVSAWELEGERLAAHRARLADGDNVCVVSGQGEAPMHRDRETEVKV
jgi:hypothetical protein